MSNSKGNYSSSRENSMRAYDQLPPSVRLALQQAAFCWAPQPIRTMFEKRRIPAKEIVKRIARWDADQIAKDRTRVWGFKDDKPSKGRQR